MFGFIKNAFTPRRDHADCSGCGLCMPVCPVWRTTRDISLTPHGRAKALQHGGTVDSTAIESCTLCMACNPVCPEQIDHVAMIIELRRKQVPPDTEQELRANMAERAAHQNAFSANSVTVLLTDAALRAQPNKLAQITALLWGEKISVSSDDGADISLALEVGVSISSLRLKHFLAPLRRMRRIIVADGLLFSRLKQWLPYSDIASLGQALSEQTVVRDNLRASDLYVIEPRAYHADYQRLVKHYDRLRLESGSAFNLDLQRIAIPPTARNLLHRLGMIDQDDDEHVRWMLHGRNITRIVVENLADQYAIEKVSDVPVVHLAELADDGVRI